MSLEILSKVDENDTPVMRAADKSRNIQSDIKDQAAESEQQCASFRQCWPVSWLRVDRLTCRDFQ